RVKLADSATRRGFAIAPGLQGALGVERRLRSVVPFVELRAGWITGSGLAILEGPLRTVSVFGGVRLETLQRPPRPRAPLRAHLGFAGVAGALDGGTQRNLGRQ